MELETHVELGLRYLGQIIALKTEVGYNPAENNGAVFKNNTFSMRAYYWGDEEKEAKIPNFKYKDFEVIWYKYLGRSSTQNRKISIDEFNEMISECISSLK